VFIGTAVGQRSYDEAAYFANKGNCFYSVLHQIGLTDRKLDPKEFAALASFRIGLTDIAKRAFGPDPGLRPADFDVNGLVNRLRAVQPEIIAFNGKKAASIFFDCKTKEIYYGRQSRTRNAALLSGKMFVLPSTSGSAKKYWDVKYWHEIAKEFQT